MEFNKEETIQKGVELKKRIARLKAEAEMEKSKNRLPMRTTSTDQVKYYVLSMMANNEILLPFDVIRTEC